MSPWEFVELYKVVDVKSVLGYLNDYPQDWLNYCPKFDGDPSLSISHVVKYLKCTLEINAIHEYALMRLFTYYLEAREEVWVVYFKPKSISSIIVFIREFLKH